ncbi:MAG: TrmJ/YjtD family RNA methyltransferase [Spirochaetia bacterium]
MALTEANIRIILVEPQESKNIGSVCRAMKTMGFGSLYIVGQNRFDRNEAAITAVHAVDVLDRAVRCSGLEEAIRDAVLVAGITRRLGKWRKYFTLSPEQLAERIASIEEGPCAVVFGNEASGLNDRDLSHCHLAAQIPSSPEFPSLNLSHAVQIITFQIFRRLAEKGGAKTFRPLPHDELDSLISLMITSLANIGFFTQGDPDELAVFLRDILARAALEKREAERLAGIFRRISGLVAHRGIDP